MSFVNTFAPINDLPPVTKGSGFVKKDFFHIIYIALIYELSDLTADS